VGKEPERLREEGEGRRVEKLGVGRMPSSERVDVKKGCGSERLKGEKKEEGGRRGQTGVCRMPSPLTAGDPVFSQVVEELRTRVSGLPIRDCTGRSNNLIPRYNQGERN